MRVKIDGVFVDVGGGVDLDPVTTEPFDRPSDWLTLPVVNDGDQKIVGLYAIYDTDSNFCAFKCDGAYTVDWGDGTAPQNVAAGVTATHNFVYSAVAGSECSRGYRQAIVTITPQAGQNLTSVDLHEAHTSASFYSTGWLDIRMAGSLIATLLIGPTSSVKHAMLELFEYVGSSVVTNFTTLFNGCVRLNTVIGEDWTSAGTNFTSMFSGCEALETVSAFDLGQGTNFSTMFNGCKALQSVPLFNVKTTGTVNFTSMFNGCSTLKSVALLDLSAGSDFTSMFQNCSSLKGVPLFDTSSGVTFSNMFNSCTSLESVPLLDLSSGTNFTSMFQSCSSLKDVALFDTSMGTNFTGMFSLCVKLETIPLFDTSSGITFTSMFSGCAGLKEVPLFDTSSGITFTGMFGACSTLKTVPLFDFSAGVTFTNIFSSCGSLQSVPLFNFKTTGTISLMNMFISCASLQTIPLFNTVAATDFANLFFGCTSLKMIPLLNASSVASFSSTFSGCSSLMIGAMSGIKASITYPCPSLSPAALNDIYTNLGSGNILSANAASCETNVTDWSTNVVNCAVSSITPGSAAAGSKVARLTSTASGEMTSAITTRVAVKANTPYTFLAKCRGPAVGLLFRVKIQWFDAGGAPISTDTGSDQTSLTPTTWTQAIVVGTSPSNAVTASLMLSATATGASQTQDFDAMALFESSTQNVYIAPGGLIITITGDNFGASGDDPTIATSKGWTVTGP